MTHLSARPRRTVATTADADWTGIPLDSAADPQARVLYRPSTAATLVNTARGGVRTDDLVTVLRERTDPQAVLDVTEPEPLPHRHPLRSLPNVVLTSHVAGSLGRQCRRMGALVVRELVAVAAGRPLAHAVDLSRLARAATP